MYVRNYSWSWLDVNDVVAPYNPYATVHIVPGAPTQSGTNTKLIIKKNKNTTEETNYKEASIEFVEWYDLVQQYGYIAVVDNANQVLMTPEGYLTPGKISAADIQGMKISTDQSPILFVSFAPAYFMKMTINSDGSGNLSQISGAGYVKSTSPPNSYGFTTITTSMINNAKDTAASFKATADDAIKKYKDSLDGASASTGIPSWAIFLIILIAIIVIVVGAIVGIKKFKSSKTN